MNPPQNPLVRETPPPNLSAPPEVVLRIPLVESLSPDAVRALLGRAEAEGCSLEQVIIRAARAYVTPEA